MYRDDLKWLECKNLEQAWELLQEDGIILYSGGLGINRTKSEKIKGFINTDDLSLKYIRYEEGDVIVGAGVSVSDLCNSPVNKGNVYEYISDAFSKAAATPIRNRMTIGGSIADFPIWSDIVPALVAVNAQLTIFDGKKRKIGIKDYIDNIRKQKHIVLNIIFRDNIDGFMGYSERLTQVRFDYPALILNMTMNHSDKDESVRVVVSGTKTKINIYDLSWNEIQEKDFELKCDFPSDHRYSADYRNKVLNIFLNQGIRSMEEK